jgi:hypothetical protein
MKNKTISIISLFFLFCVLLFVANIHAQSISTGKLVGKIFLNNGELLPGVQVEINSPALLEGKRSTVSSENGSFFFLDIPIGKYKVTASMEGFKTATYKDIAVSAGAVASVDLILEPGMISEAMEVIAIMRVVDVKTSTVDSKINKEMLAKMPTSRDAFYDLTLSTPGMFDVGKNATQGLGLSSPTAYGASTSENIFLVNGVDTTNPRGAGFGSMINVNYNAIDEVRVISLGSKAEYGNFSGVAIDVVTKSGSNKLQGSLSFYSQLGTPKSGVPKNLGRDWVYLEPGANYDAYPKKDLELDLTLGGPFISKKLWFFAAANYLDSQSKQLNFDPLAKYINRYADIKITGAPFKNHHAWVAYHYENNSTGGITDGTINWDPSMAYDTFTKSHVVSSQWQWFPSTTTFFSLKFLGFLSDIRTALPADAPDHPGYINWYKAVPFDMGVGGAFPAVNPPAGKTSRSTIQADVSHYAENFLGTHDIKFGVQYTRGRMNGIYGSFFGQQLINPYTGEDLGFFSVYNTAYMYRNTYNIQEIKDKYGDSGLIMYVNSAYGKPVHTVRTSDSLGFFLDDQWSLGKKLTMNLGLRYDQMTAKFGKGQMMEQPKTPADWAKPITAYRDRAGSENLFDFKNWSPRLGLTYQLTNDQKTALRASFGRYYTPMGVESFGAGGPDVDPGYLGVTYYEIPWAGLDANGDGIIFGDEIANATRRLYGMTPIDFDAPNQFTSPPVIFSQKIHDGMENQYTDQYTLTLEREFFRDFSVALTYIHRDTKNIIVQWPLNNVTQKEWEYERKTQNINGKDVSLYSIVLKDYDGDGVIDGNDIFWIGQNSSFEYRNMEEIDGKKARRLFKGLQLVFNKQYSNRWQLNASLLFNKSSGFAARCKRQDQDYNIEGANIYNDAWVAGINQTINNMEGPLPYTPRFEFKVSTNYTIPKIEVDLGIRFRYHTGRPAWVLGEVFPLNQGNYDDATAEEKAQWVILDGAGPGLPQQIVAQDPNEPLYLPAQKILDLHLEKTFALGRGNLHLLLDALNVLNAHDVTNAMVKGVETAGIVTREIGRVVGLTTPRVFRFGVMYDF